MRLLSLFALTLLLSIQLYSQTDQPGCQDPALAPRFPGAVLRFCETEEDMKYRIPTGPETGYQRISEWVNAEGNATRLFYITSAEASVSEIYKYYQGELAGNGFEVLAQKLHSQRNVSKLVGGNKWLVTFYKANRFSRSSEVKIDEGSMSPGGTFFMAVKRESLDGDIHITVTGKKISESENVIMLDIIQPPGMATQPAEISSLSRGGAETMALPGSVRIGDLAGQLDQEGRAIIYGLQFNFNKYVLKDESAPLLDEVGELLQRNPSVKLFVVSHTAAIGAWEDNLDLSIQRAESIVNYLIDQHGIDAARLIPYGVGSMAPLAAPITEEGRKANDRVELLLHH